MKDNNVFEKIILPIMIIASVIAVVYLPKIIKKNDKDIQSTKDYEEIKDYGVNEYIPVMIDDEQMSKRYLQDYLNILFENIDDSYNLLNKEYRDYRFGSIEKYKEFLATLGLTKSVDINKYATYEKNNYKYYDIYDKNGRRFIFKTKGVLQYELFFDEYNSSDDE